MLSQRWWLRQPIALPCACNVYFVKHREQAVAFWRSVTLPLVTEELSQEEVCLVNLKQHGHAQGFACLPMHAYAFSVRLAMVRFRREREFPYHSVEDPSQQPSCLSTISLGRQLEQHLQLARVAFPREAPCYVLLRQRSVRLLLSEAWKETTFSPESKEIQTGLVAAAVKPTKQRKGRNGVLRWLRDGLGELARVKGERARLVYIQYACVI